MKILRSGAKYSAIVGIGERIRKISQETGEEFLLLNRGVNSVCSIDLNSVVQEIDFNTNIMQVYPPSKGRLELRNAINDSYFQGEANVDHLSISGGGMSALDLVFQTLDVERIYLPEYYWGSYYQIMTVRRKEAGVYSCFKELEKQPEKLKGSAVVICDPNNPIGNKRDDQELLNVIRILNDHGVIVIVDSPYRRVFYSDEDRFYSELCSLDNVVVVESFSKSIGLSGQRLGFVYCNNSEFNEELGIRLMYATNGINAFSQVLVTQLLTSPRGKKAVGEFKKETVEGIRKNIVYLKERGLLANEFYSDSEPMGIFVIVNQSEEDLLKKRIGSVSLSYFTRENKERAQKYSRICVSVPHDKFKQYFSQFE
ncbi:MAG: pyridoxal phosphate-dependent aminotransferase [Marinifilaceae bacterium]